MANPIADRTSAIRVKLRSLKTAKGSSGSPPWRRAWWMTKMARTAAPMPRTRGIERNPLTVPQS